MHSLYLGGIPLLSTNFYFCKSDPLSRNRMLPHDVDTSGDWL